MNFQLPESKFAYYAYTGGKPFRKELPSIVLIHGAQNDHSVWILQSRYLAHHGFNVLALDLPGHGRSQGEPLRTVEEMALWVGNSLTYLGVSAYVAVGHSMGSLIALELAANNPSTCIGLGLLGSAFPMPVSTALLDACETDEPRAIGMINQWSHSGITHSPGCPGPGFSIFVQGLRLMQRQNKGVLAVDFHACNKYANGELAAAKVSAPSLIVSGSVDLMTPSKTTLGLAKALKAAGSAVTTAVIAGAGHQLMAEKPDEVLTALHTWAKSVC